MGLYPLTAFCFCHLVIRKSFNFRQLVRSFRIYIRFSSLIDRPLLRERYGDGKQYSIGISFVLSFSCLLLFDRKCGHCLTLHVKENYLAPHERLKNSMKTRLCGLVTVKFCSELYIRSLLHVNLRFPAICSIL